MFLKINARSETLSKAISTALHTFSILLSRPSIANVANVAADAIHTVGIYVGVGPTDHQAGLRFEMQSMGLPRSRRMARARLAGRFWRDDPRLKSGPEIRRFMAARPAECVDCTEGSRGHTHGGTLLYLDAGVLRRFCGRILDRFSGWVPGTAMEGVLTIWQVLGSSRRQTLDLRSIGVVAHSDIRSCAAAMVVGCTCCSHYPS